MKRPLPMVVLLVAVLPAACYETVGRRYHNVRSVGVEVFANKTLYRDVEFQLTDHVRREISARTTYTTTSPRDADAVLTGELTGYGELPEAIDENEVVTARRLIATATCRLMDNHTGETLAGPKTVRWSEVYRVRTGRPLAEVRQDTLRKLARRVVEGVFMPWPGTQRSAQEGQQE